MIWLSYIVAWKVLQRLGIPLTGDPSTVLHLRMPVCHRSLSHWLRLSRRAKRHRHRLLLGRAWLRIALCVGGAAYFVQALHTWMTSGPWSLPTRAPFALRSDPTSAVGQFPTQFYIVAIVAAEPADR